MWQEFEKTETGVLQEVKKKVNFVTSICRAKMVVFTNTCFFFSLLIFPSSLPLFWLLCLHCFALVVKEHKGKTFPATNPWLAGFKKRKGVSKQKKTNKKSKSIEERLRNVTVFEKDGHGGLTRGKKKGLTCSSYLYGKRWQNAIFWEHVTTRPLFYIKNIRAQRACLLHPFSL